MPALYTVLPRASGGGQIASADINQLVNTLNGGQNTPVSVKNTDPIAYTLQLQNTDTAGKTLLAYAADGTTVMLRSQNTGVIASPDGTAGAPIVTTTHTQTLTNKTINGLQVASGGLGIGGAPNAPSAISVTGTYTGMVSAAAVGGLNAQATLAPNANGDAMYGMYLVPNATAAGKTGLLAYGALISFAGALPAGFTNGVGLSVSIPSGGTTVNTGLNIGSNSPTGTNNYGILVGAPTGAGTNNYGVYINAPTGGSSINDALYIAGGGIVLGNSASALTFFGGTRSGKQTVTGSRSANAALASLLTALATYGLVTDSSTA